MKKEQNWKDSVSAMGGDSRNIRRSIPLHQIRRTLLLRFLGEIFFYFAFFAVMVLLFVVFCSFETVVFLQILFAFLGIIFGVALIFVVISAVSALRNKFSVKKGTLVEKRKAPDIRESLWERYWDRRRGNWYLFRFYPDTEYKFSGRACFKYSVSDFITGRDLYESSVEGDEFYLVYLRKDVYLVYNANYFEVQDAEEPSTIR